MIDAPAYTPDAEIEILYPVAKQVKLDKPGAHDRLSSYETQAYHDPETGCGVCLYRNTPVVSWTPDQIVLSNGGWWTRTTVRKMNQAAGQFGLNFRVYVVRGQWRVKGPDGVETPWGNGKTETTHVVRR